MTTPNAYTRRWFTTFLGRIDPAVVAREVAFLRDVLPGAESRVLDVCCGPGRHAIPLAASGFRVTGLDRDGAALRNATAEPTRARFIRADMRQIPLPSVSVDAVICMWQSFGHFDAAGNRSALVEMTRVVRPNGRLVVDLYHRDFCAAHVGERTIERDGDRVHERRSMHGDRLRVHLRYEAAGSEEEFDWQLYTPGEFAVLASETGLRLRVACTEFDVRTSASGDHARMQLVFDRVRDGPIPLGLTGNQPRPTLDT